MNGSTTYTKYRNKTDDELLKIAEESDDELVIELAHRLEKLENVECDFEEDEDG